MVFAETFDVNVVRDEWDWVVVAAGIVGAFGAAIAIAFAIAAQRAAAETRRDAVRERRRLFELDALRELVRAVDEDPGLHVEVLSFYPGMLRRYSERLALIEGGLSYWRRLVELDWHDEVVEASGLGHLKDEQAALSLAIFEHAKTQHTTGDTAAWAVEHERLTVAVREPADQIRGYVRDRLVRELHEAIIVRVEAGRVIRIRRTWRPSTWRTRRVGD